MKNTVVGFVLGVVVSAFVAWNVMPSMMLKRGEKPLFD